MRGMQKNNVRAGSTLSRTVELMETHFFFIPFNVELYPLTLLAPGRGPRGLRPTVNNTRPRIQRGCIPLIKSFKMAQTRCFQLYSLKSYDFLKIRTFWQSVFEIYLLLGSNIFLKQSKFQPYVHFPAYFLRRNMVKISLRVFSSNLTKCHYHVCATACADYSKEKLAHLTMHCKNCCDKLILTQKGYLLMRKNILDV